MRTLDRHILSAAFSRWAMVLIIGIFLIIFGDFVANMGRYSEAITKHRAMLLCEYYLLRFPEFMATWLPFSVAVAGLLTAAPMIRQGTLIALLASGIAPRRVFASVLGLSLGVGVLGLALTDQVIPRLNQEAKLMHERMTGRLGVSEDPPRAVGWREGGHFWCSQQALPEDGKYTHLAVFGAEGSRSASTILLADGLEWKEGRWWLQNATVVQDEAEPYKAIARCPVEEVGLSVAGTPEMLAVRLKSDSHKTSDELIAASAGWGQINLRLAFGLLPMLCLLYALPGFIRFEGRSGLGTVLLKSLIVTLLPIGAYWLLSRLLVSHGGHAVATSVAVVGALLGFGAWRWWTMRL